MEDLAIDHSFSQRVRDILLQACKPSTKYSYERKWAHFESWMSVRAECPFTHSLASVLEYLLSLAWGGLAKASIKTYLVAIAAFHKEVHRITVFAHKLAQHY